MSFKPMFGEGSIKARGNSASPLRSVSWINSSITFDNRRWECKEAELRWTAPHHLVILTEAGHTSQTYIKSDGKDIYDGRDRSETSLSFRPGSSAWACTAIRSSPTPRYGSIRT